MVFILKCKGRGGGTKNKGIQLCHDRCLHFSQWIASSHIHVQCSIALQQYQCHEHYLEYYVDDKILITHTKVMLNSILFEYTVCGLYKHWCSDSNPMDQQFSSLLASNKALHCRVSKQNYSFFYDIIVSKLILTKTSRHLV